MFLKKKGFFLSKQIFWIPTLWSDPWIGFVGFINPLQLNAYPFSWDRFCIFHQILQGIHNWWKVKKHCLRGSHEGAVFCLPRILTCFLACVCVWFWILRPDNFTGVSLWDVFLDGEPISGWKISGDSVLNCKLFRSRRRLFHWNLMVTFCARWCQAEEGPWRGAGGWHREEEES